MELWNHIFDCAKEISCTGMNGSKHTSHYTSLQQESIVDSWKVSMVNIYKWDKSTSFDSKSIEHKDIEAVHGS